MFFIEEAILEHIVNLSDHVIKLSDQIGDMRTEMNQRFKEQDERIEQRFKEQDEKIEQSVIYNFILTHFITTKNKAKYINYKFKITIITIF